MTDNVVRVSEAQLTPRGQRTRDRLVNAARAVFIRDGFLNARVTDIAETAGAAHGSFYSYFTSKEDIFRAVIRDLQEQLLHARPLTAQNDDQNTIYGVVLRANRQYFATWRTHTDLMRLWEEVALLDDQVRKMLRDSRAGFVARVQSALEELQTRGVLDGSLDARYVAYALTGMVSRFAYVWFTESEDFDFDKAAEQLSRLWTNALGMTDQTRGLPASHLRHTDSSPHEG